MKTATATGRKWGRDELCYKTSAMAILGLGPTNFAKLGIEPVKECPNPHYRSRTSYLYDRAAIEAMRDSPKVRKLRRRRGKPKDYDDIFARRYGGPRDALLDACQAMFSLNR